MNKLDELEDIVNRTGANYEEAVKALQQQDGDVEAAVKMLNSERQTKEEFTVQSDELKQKIKELVKQGSVTRLKIKRKDKTLLDIPVAAGVIGTVISPYLAAVSALAAMVTKCSIEVERAKDKVGSGGIIDN